MEGPNDRYRFSVHVTFICMRCVCDRGSGCISTYNVPLAVWCVCV